MRQASAAAVGKDDAIVSDSWDRTIQVERADFGVCHSGSRPRTHPRKIHGSAERVFRRAFHGKGRTIVRFLDALQNQSADALRRFARGNARERESQIRVVFLKAATKLEAAGGNLSQAAPLARSDFKDLSDRLLRLTIPFPLYRSAVLILDLEAAFFQSAHRHEDAFKYVERLESSHDDRHFVLRGDGEILRRIP